MSESTYYAPGSQMDTINQHIIATKQERCTGVMTPPDFEGVLPFPASVADGMVTSPDSNEVLRKMIGAQTGDVVVSLDVSDHIAGGQQALLRYCGPENERGIRENLSTFRIVTFPVGRIATWAARFKLCTPKKNVRILGWRGLGLPAEG